MYYVLNDRVAKLHMLFVYQVLYMYISPILTRTIDYKSFLGLVFPCVQCTVHTNAIYTDGEHVLLSLFHAGAWYQVWDVNMESRPVEVYPVHDYLRSRLCSLYENDSIFDRFECGWNGDDSYPSSLTLLCIV